MTVRILSGDCREILPTLAPRSVQCVVTSPPYYGLRDYQTDRQMGLEPTLAEYVSGMVDVFRLVRDVLADDGTVWLNIGDSYVGGANSGGSNQNDGGPAVRVSGLFPKRGAGLKPKDLMMVPARLAIALQGDGWYLRSDIIWHKPNPMPESVTDRPTSAHEHIFLLTKSARYYWDQDAIAEKAAQPEGEPRLTGQHKADAGGFTTNGHGNSSLGTNQGASTRNCRNVWTLATQPYSGAHFATFPPEIPRRCILAGSREGDTVLDPFGGAGTTGMVADRIGRNAILIELNDEYATLARNRIHNDAPMFTEVTK
jgi:DNA modification methylase